MPNTEEICGEFAADFIPRWGWSFPCVLPKGHDGEHRAGGECLRHGYYVMEHSNEPPQCPKWPKCAEDSPELRAEIARQHAKAVE
jgi:hypothetical protein